MSLSIEIPEDLLEAFGSETLWRPFKKFVPLTETRHGGVKRDFGKEDCDQ